MPLFGNKMENGIPSDLRKYFNSEIDKAGYKSLTPQQREPHLQEFYKYYKDTLAKKAIAGLSDVDIAAFESLMTKTPPMTPEQADDYLKRRDPQYKQHVQDTKNLTMAYIIRYMRANANR